jgi:proteasome lid subunit RPN8/RPN11
MLFIEPKVRDQMIEDGLRTFPNECCGFIFGSEADEKRTITDMQVVNNAKEGDKKRRFEISAQDYFNAEQYAQDQGLLLLGVYHSHPNHPAIPSEHDRKSAQPYFSYIILSIRDGSFDHLRSWILNDSEQFEEEKIKDNQIIQTN